MANESKDFKEFREDFFGDPHWWARDGYQLEALKRLKGSERDEAERMLLEAIASVDPRPIIGLGELRSKAAAGFLRNFLATDKGRRRFHVAVALWTIEREPEAAKAIIEIAEQPMPKKRRSQRYKDVASDRIQAVLALAEVDTPEGLAAIRQLVNDPVLRYHAVMALCLSTGENDLQKITKLICRHEREETVDPDQVLQDLRSMGSDGEQPRT